MMDYSNQSSIGTRVIIVAVVADIGHVRGRRLRPPRPHTRIRGLKMTEDIKKETKR
jgi:hypothetical protein